MSQRNRGATRIAVDKREMRRMAPASGTSVCVSGACLLNPAGKRVHCAVGPTVNLWLHLLAFAVYTGTTLAVVIMGLPLARREEDPERRRDVAAAILRLYDPLTIGALGVLIMTGAFNLTTYKDALRGLFFDRLGVLLAWKLFFTFLLVNLGAYIAFGIGHRIVRSCDSEETVDPAWVDSMLKRLRSSAVLALALIAMIVWIALRMTHVVAPTT